MGIAGLPPPANDAGSESAETIAAGGLPPWHVDELIPPPVRQYRSLAAIIGPGVVLAGSAIGAGEWLFGPAVTAQYGGTLLWLATISIVTQVFYNLEVMRYALYCGEPIFVGFFRTWPGAKFWTVCYVLLFFNHIWPFMASNAAVPLAAAVLGHLPGENTVHWLGLEFSEHALVKFLGFVVFFAAFLPLVFGGKVYTALERIMTVKLVIVFGFLVAVTVTFVSWTNVKETVSGFFRFGSIPLRAQTVIAGPHFTYTESDGRYTYTVKGSMENQKPVVTSFLVEEPNGQAQQFDSLQGVPELLLPIRRLLAERAGRLAKPGHFYVRRFDGQNSIVAQGTIAPDGAWRLADVEWKSKLSKTVTSLEKLPQPFRDEVEELVANRGFQRQKLWMYWAEHQRLPDLDWGMLAAFAAIAGSGGLSNALLSNYSRDKGWGMGAKTGAIPSAIGGRSIALSHVGKVFPITPANLQRWRGWFRYVVRDQLLVWLTCSVVGLALPCMLSLQFMRNVPVSGNRVAAMLAAGISGEFHRFVSLWWGITLLVSFLALAPNAVTSGDLIARLWTDLLWVGSRKAQQMEEHQVKYLYYGLLLIYAVWGSVALALMNPLQIAKVGAVLGNISLGFSAFHALYVNRTLLPPELRPNWFMQTGLVLNGVFFLVITLVAAWTI